MSLTRKHDYKFCVSVIWVIDQRNMKTYSANAVAMEI
jgi:hypothetical protein